MIPASDSPLLPVLFFLSSMYHHGNVPHVNYADLVFMYCSFPLTHTKQEGKLCEECALFNNMSVLLRRKETTLQRCVLVHFTFQVFRLLGRVWEGLSNVVKGEIVLTAQSHLPKNKVMIWCCNPQLCPR